MAKSNIEYISADKTDDGGMIVRWTVTNRGSRQPDWQEHTLGFEKDAFEAGLSKIIELYREKLTKK